MSIIDMSKSINPYGDGNASAKIVDALLKYFNNNNSIKILLK